MSHQQQTQFPSLLNLIISFLFIKIHRLTKDKCRLEEQVSGREADLTMARDSTRALKEELTHKTEHIGHLENELCILKVIKVYSWGWQ